MPLRALEHGMTEQKIKELRGKNIEIPLSENGDMPHEQAVAIALEHERRELKRLRGEND